jgi:hypothetical protein
MAFSIHSSVSNTVAKATTLGAHVHHVIRGVQQQQQQHNNSKNSAGSQQVHSKLLIPPV